MSQKGEKYARRMERRVDKLEQDVAAITTEQTTQGVRISAVEDDLAVYRAAVSARELKQAAAEIKAAKERRTARAAEREAAAKLRSAQDQLDMLTSGYREEDVLAQRAAVAAADAELNHAEIQVRDAVLAAPQKGIILTRAREAGAIVQAGQTVYTLTLTNPVWLRAYVDEPNLGKVKPGMSVRVAVDAAPGKTFPGTVGFISPTAEFTPKTVETREVRTALVYRLRVQVEDPENVMRQGMPVTITLEPVTP